MRRLVLVLALVAGAAILLAGRGAAGADVQEASRPATTEEATAR